MNDIAKYIYICVCGFYLAMPAAFAGIDEGNGEAAFFDTPEAFVSAIRRFTGEALEQGFASGDFQLAGNPAAFNVFVEALEDTPIIVFSDGTQEISFNDPNVFFAFLEDTFLDFGRLPPRLQEQIEDLRSQAELFKQTTTANIIAEMPGGPLDEIFSQVALGRSVFNRPFADVAPETAATATGQAEGAEPPPRRLVDELAAVLRYTRFHFKGVEGNVYGVTLGTIRETQNLRYGILAPYDRIDFDSTSDDADSFALSPFIQWILMREPVMISVGPYLFFNHTFIHDTDNFNMYGGGVSAALEKRMEWLWIRLGVAGEYVDANINHPVNNVLRFRYGGTVGFPIVADRVEGRVFAVGTVADEEFLGGDDEFASVGAEIAASISEAFALTFGYVSSVGHEHLSSHTGYLGGIFMFR